MSDTLHIFCCIIFLINIFHPTTNVCLLEKLLCRVRGLELVPTDCMPFALQG